MEKPKNKIFTIIYWIGSSQVALALIALIILISLLGAMLPQEGTTSMILLNKWISNNPVIGWIAEKMDLFDVFHSNLFLSIISLTALNTLVCIIIRIKNLGGLAIFRSKVRVKVTGFLLIHISLLGIFAGSFISAGFRMDGNLLLTEGQSFVDKHENYNFISEGTFRRESHLGFTLYQKKIEGIYQKGIHHLRTTSHIKIKTREGKVIDGIININYPFIYKDYTISATEIGFAPRLIIRRTDSKKQIINSYVALKTKRTKKGRKYHDFLILPKLKKEIEITIYPDHKLVNKKIIKSGNQAKNPILLIEYMDKNKMKKIKNSVYLGGEIDLGEIQLAFTDLRMWNSLKIVDDPGYPVLLVSLWIGVAGLILRYTQDLRYLFKGIDVSDW